MLKIARVHWLVSFGLTLVVVATTAGPALAKATSRPMCPTDERHCPTTSTVAACCCERGEPHPVTPVQPQTQPAGGLGVPALIVEYAFPLRAHETTFSSAAPRHGYQPSDLQALFSTFII